MHRVAMSTVVVHSDAVPTGEASKNIRCEITCRHATDSAAVDPFEQTSGNSRSAENRFEAMEYVYGL